MDIEITQDDGVVLGIQEGFEIGGVVGGAGGDGGDINIVYVDWYTINCG